MLVYGPIPSRRLGQSIGINHIPPKTCTYSCVYCQLGRTDQMSISRQEFFSPEQIFNEAKSKLKQLEKENRSADYFSFVPDGEPTLDINIGKSIILVGSLGIKTAVITNASLLWMEDVRQDLMNADWVSVSIDAADEETWHSIDRPHGKLDFDQVRKGIRKFSKEFKGTLVTETMFVKDINSSMDSVRRIAEEIALIDPGRAYFLVPTRPPAESGIQRPSAYELRKAAALTGSITGVDVECITGDEQEEGFFFSSDIAADILSISSVHPIREDIILKLLQKRKSSWSIVSDLLDEEKLICYEYEGKRFYRKNLIF